MGLIGSSHELKSRHPQALVDLIYDEVFSQFDDPDTEIDVIVAGSMEEESGVFTVVDYKTIRAANDLLVTGANWPEGDNEPYIDNLIAAHEWVMGLDVDGVTTEYIVFHRHPEGYVSPGGKDRRTADLLQTIDFSYEEEQRRFMVFAILNRNASKVIGFDDCEFVPLGAERRHLLMDIVVAHRLSTHLSEDSKARITDPDYWPAVEDMRLLIERIRSGQLDEHSQQAKDEFTALSFRMLAATPKPEAMSIEDMGFPDDMPQSVREAIMEMIDKLGGGGRPLPDGSGFAIPIDGKGPLGFEPPEIRMLGEGEVADSPPARPSNIFDLPAIDDLEVKGNWEN